MRWRAIRTHSCATSSFARSRESGCASPDTGWQPCHLLLLDDGDDRPTAAMPLYLKSHSRGEFVFDWAWASAYQRAGHDYYPKLLSAVPFTPVTGPRFLQANGERPHEDARALLLAGAVDSASAWRPAHCTACSPRRKTPSGCAKKA